jgi:glycolate oxidase iron-sulfur subunit
MQTSLIEPFKNASDGQEAEAILRSCVHCGFCTATCPTYQLLGDELDGPRGRIYLIKQALEGETPTRKTQLHLDRCLTCRACETTCPSGVRYGRLADIGRAAVDARVRRPLCERMLRRALRALAPYPKRFGVLLKLGQTVRPMLPSALRKAVPQRRRTAPWPKIRGLERKMLVLGGCVQSAAAPVTNAAAARVLAKLGIELIQVKGAGCCGALSHHLSAREEAKRFMRRNIDAWWPYLDAGAEAIVMTASGCGAMVREYGELLHDDSAYAHKAARVSELTVDLSEVLARENPSAFKGIGDGRRIAYHPPCTLQHAQQVTGLAENILRAAGFELTPVPDSHLCCGSAGTYSILQKSLSQQLLHAKLNALVSGAPTAIATANIGCQLHLATQAKVPVRHWIELLDHEVADEDRG